MSFEFKVYSENIAPDIFLQIAHVFIKVFSLCELSPQNDSLWMPGNSPNWIDFSIELTVYGLFVVINNNDNDVVFSLIKNELHRLEIDYMIEDL